MQQGAVGEGRMGEVERALPRVRRVGSLHLLFPAPRDPPDCAPEVMPPGGAPRARCLFRMVETLAHTACPT